MNSFLTQKQKNFVKKYLETGNATQAALGAYSTKNYDTARSIGSENLTKPHIREYIRKHFEADAMTALLNIKELAQKSKSDAVRLRANQEILNRVWGQSSFSSETYQRPKNLTDLIGSLL